MSKQTIRDTNTAAWQTVHNHVLPGFMAAEISTETTSGHSCSYKMLWLYAEKFGDIFRREFLFMVLEVKN